MTSLGLRRGGVYVFDTLRYGPSPTMKLTVVEIWRRKQYNNINDRYLKKSRYDKEF